MRPGISSYCYVWSAGIAGWPQPARPMSAAELVDQAVALGVPVLQFGDNLPLHRLSPAELAQLAARAQDAGIELETGTRGIQPEQLRQYLDISSRLHSRILRTVVDPEQTPASAGADDSLAGVNDIVSAVMQVAPDFERANVVLAIENHDRFPAAVLREICERIGSRHVGICFDTANSIGCVESASLVLETLASWIVNVHLKDYHILRASHNKGFIVEGTPLGSGALDVPALVNRLSALGYQGSLIVELWPPPQGSLDRSMQMERDWTRQSVTYLTQILNSASKPVG